MLSVLLGSAFISRQFWGWLTDRIGGLYTIALASSCQAAAMLAFVFTKDEAGLFAVSAAFGLGFSGIIPAYVVVLRQFFPADEAAWRVPVWFFANICGMALGKWPICGLNALIVFSDRSRQRFSLRMCPSRERFSAATELAAGSALSLFSFSRRRMLASSPVPLK